MMERNLDRRVEVVVPVVDPAIQQRLVRILDDALRDEANSWTLDARTGPGSARRPRPGADGEGFSLQDQLPGARALEALQRRHDADLGVPSVRTVAAPAAPAPTDGSAVGARRPARADGDRRRRRRRRRGRRAPLVAPPRRPLRVNAVVRISVPRAWSSSARRFTRIRTGAVLELEGGVGQAAEGDGQPEVDRPVGQHRRQRLAVGQAEAGEQRHQDELDHAEPPGVIGMAARMLARP